MKSPTYKLVGWMAAVCAVIIVLMPFHALLTVWLASGFGHYTALRLWKEALLLMLFVAAVFLYIRDVALRRRANREPLILLITLYTLLLLLAGGIAVVLDAASTTAFLYGLLLDSRFLVFFAMTWVVSGYTDVLVRLWKHLLLIPAAIVVGFATLQYTVLPADFLRHIGYGPDTIRPSATIDQKDAYTRIQSTLRGPNPLGAYLVLVLSALGALLVQTKKIVGRQLGLFVLGGLALVFTFSRSAWLGALLSVVSLLYMAITSTRLRRGLVVAASVGVLVFAALGYALRDNDHFQNVFFHTNEHSASAASSNAGHASAIKNGIADVVRAPLGSGTGTAGPASVYNHDHAPARIAENYYIQVAQEVGILGLGLFIAINVLVVQRLWKDRRRSSLAQLLLASFIGMTIINMLMHAWADDTLAYVWWGFAGAAVAAAAAGRHAPAD